MVEAIKTEKYDYSENADQREQIITELYELPTEQLFKVRSFARKLKEEEHRMKQLSCREHFRLTVLPLLKSFVESQGAELEITEEPDDVITATIAEVNSLNLGSRENPNLPMLLSADRRVDAAKDRLCLYLTYRLNDFNVPSRYPGSPAP